MNKFWLSLLLAISFVASANAQLSKRGFYRGGLSTGHVVFFVHSNGSISFYTLNHRQTSSGGSDVAKDTGFLQLSGITPDRKTITSVVGTLTDASVTGTFSVPGFATETFTASKVPMYGPTSAVAGRYFGFTRVGSTGSYTPITVLVDSQGHLLVDGRGIDAISDVVRANRPYEYIGGTDINEEFSSTKSYFDLNGAYSSTFVAHGVMEGSFTAGNTTYQFRATKESSANHLANISTRGNVTTGEFGNLIAGFIITGGAKTVLIRATGLPGTNTDTELALYASDRTTPLPLALAQNDNWPDNANARDIEASGIASENLKSAALLVRLEPGAYTAVLSSHGETGVALAEVYELEVD